MLLVQSYVKSFAITHEVMWPFDRVILRDLVKKNHYISNTTVSMATKLGKMVTYLDLLPPIKLFDPVET